MQFEATALASLLPANTHSTQPPPRRSPATDILRSSRDRQRRVLVATFLAAFQTEHGTRGDDGLLWITGYTWAELAARLQTRDGIPWSERTFRRAIAGLKKHGRAVVFLNKAHRGTARLRIVPANAAQRVLRAQERRAIANAVDKTSAAATSFVRAYPVPICSEVPAAEESAPDTGAGEKVRRPKLAVLVVPNPVRELPCYGLRQVPLEIAPADPEGKGRPSGPGLKAPHPAAPPTTGIERFSAGPEATARAGPSDPVDAAAYAAARALARALPNVPRRRPPAPRRE